MRTYKYKAKDEIGSSISGEVQASNEQHAAKLIRKQGLIVLSIKIKRKTPITFITEFKGKVSSSDVSNFTRQLATMINAGMPLTEALLILRSQLKSYMQAVVGRILADVEEGEALSEAMSKHPGVFGRSYIALIRSGETGGVMDEVLMKLADNLEKKREFKSKVRGALIYPTIIVIGMMVVALIMLVFVIPQLTSLYGQFDADLPLPTVLLIATSNAVRRFWYVFLAGSGIAIYALRTYRNTDKGKRKIDAFIFKIPLLGDLIKTIIIADLTRTMSLMIGSGVPILEGLSISAEVVSNSLISDALKEAAVMVEKGFPLTYAFSKHPDAFPFIVTQMIAVGEETGKMDEVLGKVSHVFEVESDHKLKAVTSAIEPIILMILGIGVAFLVISIILPIYDLTTQI